MSADPKELRAQLTDLLNKKLDGEQYKLIVCRTDRQSEQWTYVELERPSHKTKPLMAISPDGAIHNALSRSKISAKPLGNVQSSAALVKAISKIKEAA
jgi:hypothetical protein